jgi:hypothetical protein
MSQIYNYGVKSGIHSEFFHKIQLYINFYEVYTIESYESNGFIKKNSIESESYINPLKTLWIKGATGR